MTVRPEELAATLVQRRKQSNEEFRRRALFFRERVNDLLLSAIRKKQLTRAWLIGSLAWGTFGEGSRVEIVAEGLSLNEAGIFWAQLEETLDARVDLLRIEELPPSFRDRVMSEGVLLHGG